MGDRRDPTIQSVDRAARILKALAAGSPRLGVSELAERLGLAKTTVHGLLRTLERQDLVEQDPETGKYRLGPEMLQLGNAFLDHHELRGRSLVWADTLAERVGEAVRVGVLPGHAHRRHRGTVLDGGDIAAHVHGSADDAAPGLLGRRRACRHRRQCQRDRGTGQYQRSTCPAITP